MKIAIVVGLLLTTIAVTAANNWNPSVRRIENEEVICYVLQSMSRQGGLSCKWK